MRLSILIALPLLCSCYSYFPIAEEGKPVNEPKDDDRILITLKDSSMIEADAFQHVRVEEPSDFIFGVGQQMKKYTGQEYEFKGKLNRTSLDSMRILKVGGAEHLKCWLPDSTVILFKDGAYLVVTPETGSGYILRGTRSKGGKSSSFLGTIPISDVKMIEVEELDGFGTGTFLLFFVLPTAALIVILISLSQF